MERGRDRDACEIQAESVPGKPWDRCEALRGAVPGFEVLRLSVAHAGCYGLESAQCRYKRQRRFSSTVTRTGSTFSKFEGI
jgi:hypothetical protein